MYWGGNYINEGERENGRKNRIWKLGLVKTIFEDLAMKLVGSEPGSSSVFI